MEVLSDDGKVLEVREIQFHVLIFGIIYRESIRFCSIREGGFSLILIMLCVQSLFLPCTTLFQALR